MKLGQARVVITSLSSVVGEKKKEIWIHFKQFFVYMCKITYVNQLNDKNITLLA